MSYNYLIISKLRMAWVRLSFPLWRIRKCREIKRITRKAYTNVMSAYECPIV